MKLSIIVPVYNEEKTIGIMLKKLSSISIPGVKKEVIIIDDGSTDSTAKLILKFVANKKDSADMRFVQHKKNQGKGAAVRTGFLKAAGDYIIIQDADLEYDPHEIVRLIKPVQEGKAQVVYGTRLNRLPNFSKDEKTPQFFTHYVGNKFLSLLTSVFYLQWLTDMESCYKLFPKKALDHIRIRARGFEFEPEITAKLLKSGYRIMEIPISTNPRGYNQGKKLHTVRDGVKALWALAKYRFVD